MILSCELLKAFTTSAMVSFEKLRTRKGDFGRIGGSRHSSADCRHSTEAAVEPASAKPVRLINSCGAFPRLLTRVGVLRIAAWS
jgi:hypothetical protein